MNICPSEYIVYIVLYSHVDVFKERDASLPHLIQGTIVLVQYTSPNSSSAITVF